MTVERSRYVLDTHDGTPVVVDATGAAVPKSVTELVCSLKRDREQERAAVNRQRVIVQQLRIAGASWAVIGSALGVSREAAFKRYSSDRLV